MCLISGAGEMLDRQTGTVERIVTGRRDAGQLWDGQLIGKGKRELEFKVRLSRTPGSGLTLSREFLYYSPNTVLGPSPAGVPGEVSMNTSAAGISLTVHIISLRGLGR